MVILQSDVNQRKRLLEASEFTLFKAVSHQGLELTWENPGIIKTLQVIVPCFEENFIM